MKKVSILGSTGSIGQNTLDLILQSPERYEVQVLTARSNVALLAEQAKSVNAKRVVIENASLYGQLKEALAGTSIEAAAGQQQVIEAARAPCDWLISAIVGAAALAPTMEALKQGRIVALANKECLVCAGDIVMAAAARHKATIIPVDSEHNAIFQLCDFNTPDSIEHITLTASGGPFLKFTKEQLKKVTAAQAVSHPNWTMGAKISVDSATMMNKGLEIIEAYHLFPIEKQQIKVLVHPESIVHGLVHYVDGAVKAALSPPDMRVPIAFALGWPERIAPTLPKLDLSKIGALHFEIPDEAKFPALRLAREALSAGGILPCILNAANEIAVAHFLNKEISFLDIAHIVEKTMNMFSSTPYSTLEEIMAFDHEARLKARTIVEDVMVR